MSRGAKVRYGEGDWKEHNVGTKGESEKAGKWAEGWMAEALRVADQTEEHRLKGQEEVGWHFKQRLRDLELWLEALTTKSQQISMTLEDLGVVRRRLVSAHDCIPEILSTGRQIVAFREQRQGIDLVNDEPQRETLAELRLFEEYRLGLSSTIRTCDETLRIIRKFWRELFSVIEDKRKTLAIDKAAAGLNEHSTEVSRQTRNVLNDFSHLDNEGEWEGYSTALKNRAEYLLNYSDQFQTRVHSILRSFTEETQGQVCKTNAALEKRVSEMREAKADLEKQLNNASLISLKVREMEEVISKLEKSYAEKESSLALTETRLKARNYRPNLELVKDNVQRQLHLELANLQGTMGQLSVQLAQSKVTLRSLLSQQIFLQDQINLKMGSISIEETQVLPMRRSIHIHNH